MGFQVLRPRQKMKMEKERKSLNLNTAVNHIRLAWNLATNYADFGSHQISEPEKCLFQGDIFTFFPFSWFIQSNFSESSQQLIRTIRKPSKDWHSVFLVTPAKWETSQLLSSASFLVALVGHLWNMLSTWTFGKLPMHGPTLESLLIKQTQETPLKPGCDMFSVIARSGGGVRWTLCPIYKGNSDFLENLVYCRSQPWTFLETT